LLPGLRRDGASHGVLPVSVAGARRKPEAVCAEPRDLG
jgi:hypothetical protein